MQVLIPAPRHRAVVALVATVLLAACHDQQHASRPSGPAITTVATTATLAALPQLTVGDGQLICQADGQSPCPVSLATANWLHGGRMAIWEAGRQVHVWIPGHADPLAIGDFGRGDGQYQLVASVASSGKGYVVIDAKGGHALHYNADGRYESALPIPAVSPMHAIGFSGDNTILQTVHPVGPDSVAQFEVRELDAPGDTVGQVVLRTPLSWLRLSNGRASTGLPLFPWLPSYSITADSDVIWSPGDSFTVRRQTSTGQLRWTLHGDVDGPPITPEEVAAVRASLGPKPDTAVVQSFDSSVAHSGKFHPPISGLVVAMDGRVLVGGAQTSARDSLDFYVLNTSGQPQGRFELPRRTHILLFAGDSLLVQRPGPAMEQEMRWLVLKAKP